MRSNLTRAQAAQILLDRRKARGSMADYVEYLDLGFVPAKHHRLVCEKLDKVARGELNRLMISLPPGSGKSTYCSQLFPAFYLGNNPTGCIIACSHTQSLADHFGRRVRNRFLDAEHAALFGISIASDSKAAAFWSTELDGQYFAAGVGVAIAGRRADIGLIDDPHPNIDAARSLTHQEQVWNWYVGDFLPRLKPNAAQIVIATRRDERDLLGRILEREGAQWDVVTIPMEAETDDILGRAPGERLWPEYFTEEMVVTAKSDSRTWISDYQQKPVVEEGDLFKLVWFDTIYDRVPDNAHYYGASDYAVSEGRGDFTEHGIFALDSFGNLYIVDWWRGQTSADVWIEKQCDFIQEYEPLVWFGESGPIRRSIEPYLALRMTERNAGCRIEWLPSITDKAKRCRSFTAMAARKKIFLPRNAAWKGELLTQLTHFPTGRHDDAVDTCSLLGRGLDLVQAPRMKRWSKAVELGNDRELGDNAWMVS